MKEVILLNYNENITKVTSEERAKFLYNLLEKAGVDITELSGNFLDIEERIKLRNIITKYGVNVIIDNDGPLSVFIEQNFIGEWRKPTFKLKRDLSKERKKQIYIEMTLDYNHIFEDLEQQ